MIRERFVELAGLSGSADSAGSAPFRLSVREHLPPEGASVGVTFLLVHGLASNAQLWDGVAIRLAAAGHRVVAVDLRGHGLSDAPDDGYDTDTCADDLAELIEVMALRSNDGTAPVVAGQSWGGNVVLSLAARHPGSLSAVACVDGGWYYLGAQFDSFEDCWKVLAPPRFDTLRWADVEANIVAMQRDWPDGAASATLANLEHTPDGGVRARLAREHHREILHSMFVQDPATWYAVIDVPVMLIAAAGPHEAPDAVRQAAHALAHARVVYYPGAHHDLHAQHPDRLAADLLTLADVSSASPESIP